MEGGDTEIVSGMPDISPATLDLNLFTDEELHEQRIDGMPEGCWELVYLLLFTLGTGTFSPEEVFSSRDVYGSPDAIARKMLPLKKAVSAAGRIAFSLVPSLLLISHKRASTLLGHFNNNTVTMDVIEEALVMFPELLAIGALTGPSSVFKSLVQYIARRAEGFAKTLLQMQVNVPQPIVPPQKLDFYDYMTCNMSRDPVYGWGNWLYRPWATPEGYGFSGALGNDLDTKIRGCTKNLKKNEKLYSGRCSQLFCESPCFLGGEGAPPPK